ncbi:uncharacterized protein C2orf78 [Manis pentadactyla]|uniref:uncharacterized protein C2orf78 n=1 Tax=Manis pentadactyla TaxID=143292 RepID=UPI00255C8477|nr:uncharacterized protein C2orf78 [Manis pentadactyla]
MVSTRRGRGAPPSLTLASQNPMDGLRDSKGPVTSDLHPGHTCSLASVTEISSTILSSSLISTVVFSSSSLTMSENFQNPSLLGTSHSLQLPAPVVSHAASSLTGRVCDFSRVSAPTASSTWLPPSASGTSFQPLMGTAYLYQHPSTTMLSAVSSQRQISTSVGDFTMTVTNQNRAMSMATQYAQTSYANYMVPVYPSLPGRLVQGIPTQMLNQGHSLSHPYQQGSQIYYYNQGTTGTLRSGELVPCWQSYGSVTNTGSRASAPQPEMTVLQEIQPAGTQPPISTSGIHYYVSTQTITETRFQVMETSRGLQPHQIFCLPQHPHSQTIENNPPPEVGGISVRASVHGSGNPSTLPPAKNQEQTQNNNLEDSKNKLLKPLDASQITAENQDDVLLPIHIPDTHHLHACTDPLNLEKQPRSENIDLGKNSLSLEDQGTLIKENESNSSFANVADQAGDSHLPQFFSSLKNFTQSKGPKMSKTQDTRATELNQVQKRSCAKKRSSGQAMKNNHEASEPLSDAPEALEGDMNICNVADGDEAPANKSKRSRCKSPITAPRRTRKTRSSAQKTTRTRKRNSKKAEEGEQSGNKVKAQKEPTIPRMKRKKDEPELSQENFETPLSRLGMHMLESVQVFHALGKRIDKKPRFSSSQDLGNSRNPKDPQPPLATKPWLNILHEGKRLQRTHVKDQKPDGSVNKECPSPSQSELPPPGKLKFVPLHFLMEERSPVCRVPRRRQSPASDQPALASSTQPGSTNAALSTAVNSSQQAPASLTDPACSSLGPVSTNSTQPDLTKSTQPSVTKSAASRPVPYRTLPCTSLQQEPIPTAVPQNQPPPKPKSPYINQEVYFFIPRPWRISDILGPEVSELVTEEQRPEREAMKRQAQQERENAAKYTSLGKIQFFIEREKEMEIADSYGYIIM